MYRRSLLWMLGVGGCCRGDAGAGGSHPDPPQIDRGRAVGGQATIGPHPRRVAFSKVCASASAGHTAGSRSSGSTPSPGAPLAVRTLAEARSRGELVVTERDQATVSALVVENRGPVHVLLLAGEILQGGKQNRIVVEDVLVPPRSGP